MIDSVVFIKQDIEDVINYYLSISDSERIVENENIIVDNLLFKEKNDWTYIINLEGDAFSEEFLLVYWIINNCYIKLKMLQLR